jgi:hypothetical protein
MSKRPKDPMTVLRRNRRRAPRHPTPGTTRQPRPDLVEVPAGPAVQHLNINRANSYLRTFTLGECSVIVTKEYDRWHLSIAHPRRDPTWEEIKQCRYALLPSTIVVAMLLPPPAQYVNIHEHCFQMMEIRDPDLPHRF